MYPLNSIIENYSRKYIYDIGTLVVYVYFLNERWEKIFQINEEQNKQLYLSIYKITMCLQAHLVHTTTKNS